MARLKYISPIHNPINIQFQNDPFFYLLLKYKCNLLKQKQILLILALQKPSFQTESISRIFCNILLSVRV